MRVREGNLKILLESASQCSLFFVAFSLTLSVAFSQKQLEMLYTEWKAKGRVQMKALRLMVPNTALSSSLQMELSTMSTNVTIDTYTPNMTCLKCNTIFC